MSLEMCIYVKYTSKNKYQFLQRDCPFKEEKTQEIVGWRYRWQMEFRYRKLFPILSPPSIFNVHSKFLNYRLHPPPHTSVFPLHPPPTSLPPTNLPLSTTPPKLPPPHTHPKVRFCCCLLTINMYTYIYIIKSVHARFI